MTTIAGPVVAKRPGEKWSGVCVPSLVFLPLPLRPQHNWAAVRSGNWSHQPHNIQGGTL